MGSNPSGEPASAAYDGNAAQSTLQAESIQLVLPVRLFRVSDPSSAYLPLMVQPLIVERRSS